MYLPPDLNLRKKLRQRYAELSVPPPEVTPAQELQAVALEAFKPLLHILEECRSFPTRAFPKRPLGQVLELQVIPRASRCIVQVEHTRLMQTLLFCDVEPGFTVWRSSTYDGEIEQVTRKSGMPFRVCSFDECRDELLSVIALNFEIPPDSEP